MFKHMVCLVLIISGVECKAQSNYKELRSEFSEINSFGLPNDYTHTSLKLTIR